MTEIKKPIMGKTVCSLLGAVALTIYSAPASAGALDYFQNDYSLLFTPNNAIEFGGTYVVPDRSHSNVSRSQSDFDPSDPLVSGATRIFQALAFAIDGQDSGNFADSFFLPKVSLKYSLTDDLGCMGSIRYPYGTHQDAGAEWAGRHYAIETDITNVSYNLDCMYSFDVGNARIGLIGGLRRETSDVKLSQALSGAGLLGGAGDTLGAAAQLGLYSVTGNSNDSLVTLEADSAETGYTAGIAVDLPEYGFKLHAIYQSEIEHNYSGTQTINVNANLVGAIGTDTIVRQGGGSLVTSPQSLQINVSKQLDDGWGVLGFVRWVDWSQVQTLEFSTDNGQTSVSQLNWKDGWTYGAGVSKLISPKLAMYGILAYDQDTSDDRTRSPRSASFDSITASLGATIAVTDSSYLKLSGSYRRAFSGKVDEYEPTVVFDSNGDGASDPAAGGSISSENDASNIFIGRAVLGFVF